MFIVVHGQLWKKIINKYKLRKKLKKCLKRIFGRKKYFITQILEGKLSSGFCLL